MYVLLLLLTSLISFIINPLDTQLLFAAVVLTDDQLIVHDLQSQG